jgi:hypothetical protein
MAVAITRSAKQHVTVPSLIVAVISGILSSAVAGIAPQDLGGRTDH